MRRKKICKIVFGVIIALAFVSVIGVFLFRDSTSFFYKNKSAIGTMAGNEEFESETKAVTEANKTEANRTQVNKTKTEAKKAKVQGYEAQIELNKLGSINQENIAGAKFRVTDLTEYPDSSDNLDDSDNSYNSDDSDNSNNLDNSDNSDVTDTDNSYLAESLNMQIKIYNRLSGEEIEVLEDGTFIVPEEGVVLGLTQISINTPYELLIEEIDAPEGFYKTLQSLVLEISIDDNEVISAQIKTMIDANGNETDVLNQDIAKLEGADETGKVQIRNEQDSNTTIKYKLGEDGDWQEYTEDVKVYENTTIYAKSIKDGVESDISFKVINNIDKIVPTLESMQENNTEDIETLINIVLTDKERGAFGASGIVKYGISTSTEQEPETYNTANRETRLEATIEHIEENGTYYIWIWDAAGNCGKEEIQITTVNEGIFVAEITYASEGYEDLIGTKYGSLAAALAVCPELGEGTAAIQIIHDIYNESNTVNKDVTIDLNGYTIASRKTNPTVTVEANSTLKIVNSELSGEIVNENATAIVINKNGTLTVGENDKSVTIAQPSITGKGVGIRNNGTFNFYDGNITAKADKDGNTSAIYGKVTDIPVVYSVSTVDYTEPENMQKASLGIISGIEARIGRKTYTKLEDAVADAGTTYGKDGSQVEIVIVSDLAKADTIVVDETKNIKLDLNGCSFTTLSEGYVLENYGQLEIVDTSDEQTGIITSTTNSTIYNGSKGEYIGDAIEFDLSQVKKYSEDDEYYFVYDEENGRLVNTNNDYGDSLNTNAISYLELDLTGYEGKYTLAINAELSAYSYYNECGYVSITNTPDNSSNVTNSSYGNIIRVSGKPSNKDYTFDLAGGQKYYLNIRYSKTSTTNSLYDDEFRINNVTITKKQEGKFTLTSGTVDIAKAGTYYRYSYTYYYAINNEGHAYIQGGNITGDANYTVGVATGTAGTTNISGGNISISGSGGNAIMAYGSCSVTKVTSGDIYGAQSGVHNNVCLANVYVTGGNFSDNCYYQIWSTGQYSLITLDGVTLSTNNGYNVYRDAQYVDIVINNCEMSNTNGAAVSKVEK